MVVYVQMCSTESKAAMGRRKKLQAARQERQLHDNLPDDVVEFDANIQKGRKKLENPVEPAMPGVTQVRIPTRQDTNVESCSVKKAGGWKTSALSEGRLSLTEKERVAVAFESQRCILR